MVIIYPRLPCVHLEPFGSLYFIFSNDKHQTRFWKTLGCITLAKRLYVHTECFCESVKSLLVLNMSVSALYSLPLGIISTMNLKIYVFYLTGVIEVDIMVPLSHPPCQILKFQLLVLLLRLP